MRSLAELLGRSAARFPTAPAVTLHGRQPWTWSYAELWEQSRRAATYLQTAGVGKGDRVVIWGPNRPEWVAAFFAAHLLGAVVVPLDARSREDLLIRIEEQTGPKHLFLGSEQARGLKAQHPPITVLEELRERIAEEAEHTPARGTVTGEDIAELVFTSGTTGQPKGVILTHNNVLANVKMGRTAFRPTLENHVISLLPLSHMFEQISGLLIPMTGGSSITYVASLRPDNIFNAMQEMHITNMGCVPQVLQLFKDGIEREVRKQGKDASFAKAHRIARYLPLAARRRLFKTVHERMGGQFEYFVSGGAYLDPDLARWWERMGFKVAQGYGMTEAAPVVACHTVNVRDPDSVGKPLPGVEITIAEDSEILVKGPNLTPGYWENPSATAAAFTEDGWYMTGDLGFFDKQGRLHLHGRKKNMIVLANGLNVYPEDVEHVLTADPRIKEAAVFGVGERQDVQVHAVLLTEQPEEAAAVIKQANGRLGPHQQIRGHTIWPEAEFPMTPTLKVKRAEVEERLTELRGERVPARV